MEAGATQVDDSHPGRYSPLVPPSDSEHLTCVMLYTPEALALCWAGPLEGSPCCCWAQSSRLRALICFYPQSQQMWGWFITAISGVHLRPSMNLLHFSSAQLCAGAERSWIPGISLIKKGDPVALRLLGSFWKERWWVTIWVYLILLD